MAYKKRFEKYGGKMFTFLGHDVPWNNNNAEHAVKAFACLRSVIGGSSSPKGIREYLVLLSIYASCKFKGVNFLEFMLSASDDVNRFAVRRARSPCRGAP